MNIFLIRQLDNLQDNFMGNVPFDSTRTGKCELERDTFPFVGAREAMV